mgnify:CR=1 FL=1
MNLALLALLVLLVIPISGIVLGAYIRYGSLNYFLVKYKILSRNACDYIGIAITEISIYYPAVLIFTYIILHNLK